MRNDSPYTPLLNGPRDNHRRELLLVFSGLLLLASIIAFSGFRREPHADVSSSSSSSSFTSSDEATKPSAVSRGVSSGVSEKSNTFLSGSFSLVRLEKLSRFLGIILCCRGREQLFIFSRRRIG
ncbi:unnamed protein product [Lathyrus sativus]|nr:unnamed protein product [Lathyrus sativus]